MSEARPTIAGTPRINMDELFRSNMPPIMVAGSTGTGKTYLMIDALYTNAPIATKIVIIANSYETPENEYLRRHIDRTMVREFDVKLLWDLWIDITTKQDLYNRYTRPESVGRFIQKFGAKSPEFQARMQGLNKLQDDVLKQVTNADEQRDYIKAINIIRHEEAMAFIANNFNGSMSDFTEEERMVVIFCRSTPPFPIIMFDDVTASLKTLKSSKAKIMVSTVIEGEVKKEQMTEYNAAQKLITEMMTRGRHYCVTGFFIHSFATFDAETRQLSGPIVISSPPEAEEISRQKIIPPQYKSKIKEVLEEVMKKDLHNKVVFFPNASFAPLPDHVLYYTKADPHETAKPLGCPNLQRALAEVKRLFPIRESLPTQ